MGGGGRGRRVWLGVLLSWVKRRCYASIAHACDGALFDVTALIRP